MNIRLGAAYLAQLRGEFNSHGRLYLAAYNMGSTNVQRALAKQIFPKEYPGRVMVRYMRFYSEYQEARSRYN
jgi:soluble lytic murein transglycosylase-like protein